jgi:hypothetical protein
LGCRLRNALKMEPHLLFLWRLVVWQQFSNGILLCILPSLQNEHHIWDDCCVCEVNVAMPSKLWQAWLPNDVPNDVPCSLCLSVMELQSADPRTDTGLRNWNPSALTLHTPTGSRTHTLGHTECSNSSSLTRSVKQSFPPHSFPPPTVTMGTAINARAESP